MDAPMVSALPATAAAPHSDAMAAAPASAPEEEAVVVEDVPELRNLDAYEGGDDDEELPGIAPPPVARVAAEKRTGDKRRPLSHLTRLEFLTDLVRPHPCCAALGARRERGVNGQRTDCCSILVTRLAVRRSTSCGTMETATLCQLQVRAAIRTHAHAPGWGHVCVSVAGCVCATCWACIRSAQGRSMASDAAAATAHTAGSNPYWFPEKKLNGKQLDLFALYKQASEAASAK